MAEAHVGAPVHAAKSHSLKDMFARAHAQKSAPADFSLSGEVIELDDSNGSHQAVKKFKSSSQ
jgi:hypothetical protein